MKIKNNKIGFTLVELLAVIVILAVIMVLVAPTVISSMNNAQKKSFQIFAEKMITKAQEVYGSQDLLGGSFTHHYSTTQNCYTLEDLGFGGNKGSYKGFIVVKPGATATSTEYVVYLTDEAFVYNGVDSGDVLKDASSIAEVTSDTLSTYLATMSQCV